MSSIDQQTANQIANIEKASGRTFAEWVSIIQDSGIEKHSELVAMLKERYGLTHGNANTLVLNAREAAAGGTPSAAQLIDSHYTGKNASLRPLYEAVIASVREFGSDIELDPKKTYVSLRRRKQFGQVGPAAGQLEVGVTLPGREPTDGLRATTGMATHRVRISDLGELDEELIGWLREAYERG